MRRVGFLYALTRAGNDKFTRWPRGAFSSSLPSLSMSPSRVCSLCGAPTRRRRSCGGLRMPLRLRLRFDQERKEAPKRTNSKSFQRRPRPRARTRRRSRLACAPAARGTARGCPHYRATASGSPSAPPWQRPRGWPPLTSRRQQRRCSRTP